MRPIKFRAWDEEAEKMFYSGEIESDYFFEFKNGKLRGFAIRPPKSSSDPMEPPEPYCDDYPVMQFINLKDKNGKDDWIDDIVETKVGGFTYRRRIFQAESGAFCINLPVFGATGGEDAIMLITCEHENIGNVHSNPKLLEEKK